MEPFVLPKRANALSPQSRRAIITLIDALLAHHPPESEVLAYLPVGISLTDAAKVGQALAQAYPDATAKTKDLPAGMSLAIMRPVEVVEPTS